MSALDLSSFRGKSWTSLEAGSGASMSSRCWACKNGIGLGLRELRPPFLLPWPTRLRLKCSDRSNSVAWSWLAALRVRATQTKTCQGHGAPVLSQIQSEIQRPRLAMAGGVCRGRGPHSQARQAAPRPLKSTCSPRVRSYGVISIRQMIIASTACTRAQSAHAKRGYSQCQHHGPTACQHRASPHCEKKLPSRCRFRICKGRRGTAF